MYNSTVLHNWKETASGFAFSNLTNHTETHGSETYKVKSGLSDEGRATLCCHMSTENEVFEDIVRGAINLGNAEKEEYLSALYSDCNVSQSDLKKYRKSASIGSVNSNGEMKNNQRRTVFSWSDWSNEKGCNITNNM